MFKKFKSKFVVTVIIALAVIVFVSIPVSALTFIGTAGGGAGGGSTNTNNNYSVSNTSSTAAGYRFSLIDYYGNTKYQVIDILCSNYNYIGTVKSCYRFNLKLNKKQLINNIYSAYSSSVIEYSNDASTNVYLDSDIGILLSSSPANIISTIEGNQTVSNAICMKLGMSGIDAISNGDKLLVEPLFNVTIKGQRHCVTVSEIGVWGGYEFGWAQPTNTINDGGESWGWIAGYTNSNYPSSLYTGATDFWGAGGNMWTSDKSFTLVNFYDCVTKGYGVGFAINNTTPPTQPVDLYCWGVEWYSDAEYKNYVAESTLNTNNAGENLVEGKMYYPKFLFRNKSGYEVKAWFSVLSYNNAPYGVWEKLCEPITISAYGWYGYYGEPVTISNSTLYSQYQNNTRWDDYYFNGGSSYNLIKYWLEIQPDDSNYYESNSDDNTYTTISGFAPKQVMVGASLLDSDFWGDSLI